MLPINTILQDWADIPWGPSSENRICRWFNIFVCLFGSWSADGDVQGVGSLLCKLTFPNEDGFAVCQDSLILPRIMTGAPLLITGCWSWGMLPNLLDWWGPCMAPSIPYSRTALFRPITMSLFVYNLVTNIFHSTILLPSWTKAQAPFSLGRGGFKTGSGRNDAWSEVLLYTAFWPLHNNSHACELFWLRASLDVKGLPRIGDQNLRC